MKNKIVVITGASSGIGKACAHEFASRGAKLVLSARSGDKLNQLAKELEHTGTETLIVKADVSQESDCKQLIASTINKWGKIDVLINNAGISMRAAFKDIDVSVIKNVMDVNFWGAVYCTRYAVPHLIESKGTIVGISSIAGYRGLPGRTGYSASKFAMNGFLEALRTEVMNLGVNVLTVAPGFTASNIRNTALNSEGKAQAESPLNEQKLMTSEEVATHIYKGVVRRKRTITLTSQGKMTVFMNKWFPGIMDNIVYKHMKKEKDAPF